MPGRSRAFSLKIKGPVTLPCGMPLLDVMRMDEEEDDLCTPHKLFNLFSMCTLPSTTTQTKMEADESSVRQVLHHSSVVGDHIHTSFMFVVFMHFSLYY